VLLGLRRFDPALFTDIDWSTPSVAAETLSRIAQLGWSVRHNAAVHDVDRPDDLKWLPHGWIESVQQLGEESGQAGSPVQNAGS